MGGFSAIASVGSSLIGGIMGKSAANKAAKAQIAANAMAIKEQERARAEVMARSDQYIQQGRKDLSPFMQGGSDTFELLTNLLTGKTPMSQYAALSPGYNFMLSEGTKSLENSQRARGNLLSGGGMKEMADYTAGLASTEFQNYIGNLLNASQLGGNAAANAGQLQMGGLNTLGNIMTASTNTANLLSQNGAARGNSILAGSNAITGGINSAVNSVMALQQNQQLLNLLGGTR